MNNKHEQECSLIRSIAREQCEQEARNQSNVTHTPIEQLPVDQLTAEQCVLLWAIALDRMRKVNAPILPNGRTAIMEHGTPVRSVNPCEPLYHPQDAERVQETLASLKEQTELRSAAVASGRKTKRIESRLSKLHAKLAELAIDEQPSISMAARSVWAWLAVSGLTNDEVVRRAKAIVTAQLSGPSEGVVIRPPYDWPSELSEDKWVYDNIHGYSFEDLRVEHSERCQSASNFKKPLTRNQYKTRADRYKKYHGLPTRRFKNACECPACQPVSDTPLTPDQEATFDN